MDRWALKIIGSGLWIGLLALAVPARAEQAPRPIEDAAGVPAVRQSAARGHDIPGDFDHDGDLDLDDYAQFIACLTGPWGPVGGGGCDAFDLEADGDVDLVDYAGLIRLGLAIDCYLIATSSSEENDDPQYAGGMAVDGNFATRWSSAFADNQWLEIDCGRMRNLRGLTIHWEAAYAREYAVLVSADQSNWTLVHARPDSDGGVDDIDFAPVTARYVRIHCVVRATPYGNSIWEVVLKSDDNCYEPPVDVDQRIEDLIAAMTLEEKTSFVYGATYMDLLEIPRLGIPSLKVADGPVGIRWGQATAFPATVAWSASWDVDLVHRAGVAMGKEFRNKGRHVWLGPCMNIVRVPIGGRNFETYGEDPYLNSRMAVASITGAQSQKVLACAKHFACNNQEYDRHNINIQVDERTFREIYLPAFKAAVTEAGVWSVMSAYNRLNGPYCTANSYLQQTVLKDQWGFQGFVVSDWGAVHETVAPANAGLDLEMDGHNPSGTYWGSGQLLAAVNAGQVAVATVEDKVRRILRGIFQAGIMTEPWPAPDVELVEHRPLVREIAAEGMVLLKNAGGVLPLDKSAAQTIAVIGPNADVARIGGGGSSVVTPFYAVSPLAGLQNAAGANVTLVHQVGVLLDNAPPPAASSSFVPPSGVGQGLQGEYFNNTGLQGSPVLVRTDPAVDFDWGDGSPGTGVNADNYSVRWSGSFTVPTSGDYTVATATDDGVRLWIDGQLVIDDWNAHATKLNKANLTLQAGQSYELVMEYFEAGGSAVARLSIYDAAQLLADAVSAAANADAAVVCVGLTGAYESEGFDRETFAMPAGQDQLIQQVAAANPNTIVVVIAGSQVDMAAWVDDVPVIVQAWYGGQEGGNALADVLFGDVNPSGKLPVTFVRQWSDLPTAVNYPGGNYTEGLYVGYRHFDKFGIEPLFAFGHGLSYSTFAYDDLVIDTSRLAAVGKLDVSLTVENTGSRAGAEVVQLYVRDVAASVDRPVKELKRFAKVDLAPGETQTVAFELTRDDLSYYDVNAGAWVTEPGAFEVLIGASSRDIRLGGAFTLPAQ